MMKILIADDERYERALLAQILDSRLGPDVQYRMARNGREAVDLAALWAPDVALMDIEMPGMNGLEAARQLLALHPGCKILFITAYSLFAYAREAVKLGASDYILKPVDPEDVERAVRRAAEQREALRQLEGMAPEAAQLDGDASYDKAAVLMAKVQKYLRHNYMRYDISLDAVSALVNINPSYFSTQFKRVVGVNFLDYLTDLRIGAAKELLSDPMRPAAEVAGLVGYESPSYFARAFKKRTGMTPTEYRRRCLRQGEGHL